MSPTVYLHRGGLTIESSSTFSSLGLSSCRRSVPLIKAAHHSHKEGGKALNAPISRESLMNQHSARGPTCERPLPEGSCSNPVGNMLKQGRSPGERKRSVSSTETNGSVPLEIRAPTEDEPYPSTLKSALAKYPLSHMDMAAVPSTPKHVAIVERKAAFEKNHGPCAVITAGFNHNSGHSDIFFSL